MPLAHTPDISSLPERKLMFICHCHRFSHCSHFLRRLLPPVLRHNTHREPRAQCWNTRLKHSEPQSPPPPTSLLPLAVSDWQRCYYFFSWCHYHYETRLRALSSEWVWVWVCVFVSASVALDCASSTVCLGHLALPAFPLTIDIIVSSNSNSNNLTSILTNRLLPYCHRQNFFSAQHTTSAATLLDHPINCLILQVRHY